MANFEFWRRWLQIVGLGMCLFGILMALGSTTPLFDAFNEQINNVFWGETPLPLGTQAFQGWAYGVWGATVAGYGGLAAVVAGRPFQTRSRWIRNGLVGSIVLWFVLDSGLSAAYGVWFNVAFNFLVLLLIALPLWMTRSAFDEDSA
jgi:hypothetical protein